MQNNVYIHLKTCLCHHPTNVSLSPSTKAWGWEQSRDWEEALSCTSWLLERLSLSCSSTVAHLGILVFLNWPYGRLPDLLWQVQLCGHLLLLPRTAFLPPPPDLSRNEKSRKGTFDSSIGQSPSRQGFCSPLWVAWNELGDTSLWHFTTFFWPT